MELCPDRQNQLRMEIEQQTAHLRELTRAYNDLQRQQPEPETKTVAIGQRKRILPQSDDNDDK